MIYNQKGYKKGHIVIGIVVFLIIIGVIYYFAFYSVNFAKSKAPTVSDIPDQTISDGESFAVISLDDYVSDPESKDDQITWEYSGNKEATVEITNRVATITYAKGWTGNETITFTATDEEHLTDEDSAIFTVGSANQPPVVSDIPDQTIDTGSGFEGILYDSYVNDPDNTDGEITWTYSGNNQISITIADQKLNLTFPENWSGVETITFTATDPSLNSDANSAVFTVNPIAPTFGSITSNSIEIIKPNNTGTALTNWNVRRGSDTPLALTDINSTFTDTDLTENTSYTYYARFKNSLAQFTGYSGTAATIYTLADTPTNLTATPGESALTLSVDEFTNDTTGSSGYYFTNLSTGANSGWIQDNSWTNPDLTCNTSYRFEVKYRNASGSETTPLTASQATGVCFGAGGKYETIIAKNSSEPSATVIDTKPAADTSKSSAVKQVEEKPTAQIIDKSAATVAEEKPAATTSTGSSAVSQTNVSNPTLEKIAKLTAEPATSSSASPAPATETLTPANNSQTNPTSPSTSNNTAIINNLSSLPLVTKTLTEGSGNGEVIILQERLHAYGFNGLAESTAPIIFNEEVKATVENFQKAVGINPIGVVGPRTIKALNGEEFISNVNYVFTKKLKYNDRNNEVVQLQTRLRDQGYFPYATPSTGWYGPVTRDAVKLFQKYHNLPESGEVGQQTLETLNLYSK